MMPLEGEASAGVSPEMTVIAWALVIMTVLSLFGFVMSDFAKFAQTLLDRGLVSKSSPGIFSWVARVGHRASIRSVWPVLESVGIDGAISAEIRRGLHEKRVRNVNGGGCHDRPDKVFVAQAREWIIDFSSDVGVSFGGNNYYWDLMAGSSAESADDGSVRVSDIMRDWIYRLRDADRIDSYDIVIAPKDGNVRLAQQVASQLSRPLILARGRQDNARVGRTPEDSPHITDFEGLGAYIAQDKNSSQFKRENQYRALLIDDSCRGGSVLLRTRDQFNALIPELEALGRKFDRIDDAVILFRIVSDRKGAVDHDKGFTLRALIGVSQAELKRIIESKDPLKDGGLLAACKKSACCIDSREILKN